MTSKYNPSINILRDLNEDITYFPTQNARRVAEQIETSFISGTRVFNIIGSYGTGKSSFLWALAQTIQGKKHYFDIEAPFENEVYAAKARFNTRCIAIVENGEILGITTN